ncbi:MAG: SUMF1/EgtB/PvdO family nonheme iron enzyme [Chitinophagaceae bacterium]|nr:SUMF1/EgtB/PvdO family nonheme iron enzyme [Chitinophagaceae bacterium]
MPGPVINNVTRFFKLLQMMLFAAAIQAQPAKSVLKAIPASFAYKNEMGQFIFVPGGEFRSGIVNGHDSLTLILPAVASVNLFYLNQYEVSNAAYREFVKYVLDSTAKQLLGHFVAGSSKIDWTQSINWDHQLLAPLIIPSEKRWYGKKEIDTDKILYRFENGETQAVYPDTLVWIRDFAYSYNEPMTKRYFAHPAFDNYPVVGVSAKQAIAYCEWKTRKWNESLVSTKSNLKITLRLPAANEWEYAAQQGAEMLTENHNRAFNIFDRTQTKAYPNPANPEPDNHIRNLGYKYNFGRIVGPHGFMVKSYADDGCFYTAPRNAYKAGNTGCYNLHGNVAEWTSSAGSENPLLKKDSLLTKLIHDLSSSYPRSPLANKNADKIGEWLRQFTIVKGGSWESDPYYLQPGVNQYFREMEQHSFIGFRLAMDITKL